MKMMMMMGLAKQLIIAMLVIDTLQYFIHRTAIFFFSLATIKTVDDHCGLWLPGNPFHIFFSNNSAFHDVHHQLYGSKYNFSQPFFVVWDRILGTYFPYSLDK
ncbi:unnamed protein product [Cochlearia groenlandica]